MSTQCHAWAAVALLATSPSALAAQASAPTDEADVRAAAFAFVLAFNNLDWPRFTASFDSAATIFHPTAAIASRIEGRDSLVASFQRLFASFTARGSGPPYLDIRPVDLQIQMLGDAALVTFHLRRDGSLGRRTLVFVRREGRWLIVHLHASVLTPP